MRKSMMGLMLGALAMSSQSNLHGWEELTKEEKESKKRRLVNSEIENKKTQGLKEFFYGENSLFALNKKNADRKAKAKGWI